MKIFNIMLSRDLGGIQQSFIDYYQALKNGHFEVENITSIRAKINSKVRGLYKLPNLGAIDVFSIFYLWLIVKITKPQILICHGRRAVYFSSFCSNIIIVGIAHNYSIKDLKKCDYVIALTKHMKHFLIKNGFNNKKICVIPNMLSNELRSASKQVDFHNPVVIGVIARFVKKKGVDLFLQALALLKNDKYKFQALIAGDGEEKENLINLSKELRIDKYVKFIGWVEDKKTFYNNIDIFCLSSLHEPFGIVLLEAMSYKLPIISSNTEGPSEILRHNKDGIIYEKDSVNSLFEAFSTMLSNPKKSLCYGKSAHDRVMKHYSLKAISKRLRNFLISISTQ